MASDAEAVPDAENLCQKCLSVHHAICRNADAKVHTRVHGLLSFPICLSQFRNVIPTLKIYTQKRMGQAKMRFYNVEMFLDRQELSCMHLAHHELESFKLMLFSLRLSSGY